MARDHGGEKVENSTPAAGRPGARPARPRVTIGVATAHAMSSAPHIPPSRDLTRILLASALLVLLIAGSFWILRPFLPALVWSTMIVVATWPLMRKVEARLGGRRRWAVLVMTSLILLIVVLPLGLAIGQIVGHVDQIAGYGRKLATMTLPALPEWVTRLPLMGARITTEYAELSVAGPKVLTTRIEPYTGQIASWIASEAGSIGMLFVHFVLTIVLTVVLYSHGEVAANAVRRFALRLAGDRGHRTVQLAGAAIRAVALGIVVTAFLQSVLGGIGLAVAGVPYAAVLTAVIFMLCLAQLGPLPVLAPVVIWLYFTDAWVVATILGIWSVAVSTLDGFVRPMLIQRGVKLPLLLIMSGVIGGLLAFGIVGLFVGPVILAVTYTLLNAWMDELPDAKPPAT
jgi:predicted PurR-regulated permease PerM